jgi:SAM-dependent methyltransferase
VLEAGCAVGEQTVVLATNSPLANFTSVDGSPEALLHAQRRAQRAGLGNVHFQVADVHALPFPRAHFDHVFAGFVLEHRPDPAADLAELRRVLKPGGTITVVETDPGPASGGPGSADARDAIAALVELRRRAGGDARIGRRLQPLLTEAGFRDVEIPPGTRRTFPAGLEGVREEALAAGRVTADGFDAGIADLHRAADEGTLSYPCFTAVAVNPAAAALPSQML